MISLGGAIGAALVGIVAPLVLPADFELAGALAFCALLLLWQARREPLVYPRARDRRRSWSTVGCGVLGSRSSSTRTPSSRRATSTACCASGSVATGDGDHVRPLIHGTILHGKQYLRADLAGTADAATTPPTPASGASSSRCIRARTRSRSASSAWAPAPSRPTAQGRRLPLLRHQPGRHRHRPARLHVPQGQRRHDRAAAGRRTAQARARGRRRTSTCSRSTPSRATRFPCTSSPRKRSQVYLKHMKPDGVIAFHVTNRYLDLVPVVEGIAARARPAHAVDRGRRRRPARQLVDWVLVAKEPARLNDPALVEAATHDRRRAATGGCGPTTSTISCRC